MCEETSVRINRTVEEHKLTQAAYEDVKQILESKIKVVNELTQELKVAKEDIVKLKALKDKPNSADDMKQMEKDYILHTSHPA